MLPCQVCSGVAEPQWAYLAGRHSGETMEILAKLQKEVQHIGWVTLYFFICFSIILTLKKLLLASYHIEFYALSMVVIGALLAGKIVVVLDKTGIATRFDAMYPLGVAAMYKTLIYCLITFVVLLAEKLFHTYKETHTVNEAFVKVWAHHDRNVIFAKILCIILIYFLYHLYRGIDRRLGEGTLLRMVFSRP